MERHANIVGVMNNVSDSTHRLFLLQTFQLQKNIELTFVE